MLVFPAFLLEHGVLCADLANDSVRDHNESEADNRLENACGRGTADAARLDQCTVDVGVDGLGSGEQGAGVLGDLVEQAEVGSEDTADRHQDKGDNLRDEAGQGDPGDLLPFVGAVQLSRFIESRVDTSDTGDIDEGAVANTFPAVDEDQDERPRDHYPGTSRQCLCPWT